MTRGGQAAHPFSCDVEEYFQVSACEHALSRARWRGIPSRLELGLSRILDLCDECGVRGTFFVLGWNADHHPRLVREIASRGHELACHGYEHRLVYSQSEREFKEDLDRAMQAIEDATGQRVVTFRAPSFSITPDSLWALDCLVEAGIEIDSSVFPVRHDRYGFPGAPRSPYRPIPGADLVEVPPATLGLGPLTLPFAGGGYFRLVPLWVTLGAINLVARSGARALVYIHPWELDPEQPRLPLTPLPEWRHRVGLGRVETRLKRLFARLPFGTLGDYVRSLPRPIPVNALSSSS